MTTKLTFLLAPLALLGTALSLPAAADFSWPTSGTVTSTYGEWRGDHSHKGVDIANSTGTHVRAARGGTIRLARTLSGYGKVVYVAHSYGYETRYAHNNSFYRTSGAVSRGWLLAYMGSTGVSSGPHCHFEILRYGTAQSIPATTGARVTVGGDVPKNYPDVHN